MRGWIGAAVLLTSCGPGEAPGILLATTTSVEATGIGYVFADAYEARTGEAVRILAVGSGAAARLARDRQVDVVILHDPALVEELRGSSDVSLAVDLMENRFGIASPRDDRAGIAGSSGLADAFRRIRDGGARFASRGDESGTHARERRVWEAAGGAPSSEYFETGRGMLETLDFAFERRAYALTDEATFAQFRKRDGMRLFVWDEPLARNVYTALAVEGARGEEFVRWLQSEEAMEGAEELGFRPLR